MTSPNQYDALIVDLDSATRMRLKQATSSIGEFQKVTLAANLQEASTRLFSSAPVDICFISSLFPSEETFSFVKKCKKHKHGQDAAYVTVLKGSAQTTNSLAGSVISGFDGMLFEPYSVDQLVELTRIAARVRKERSGARESVATQMLLQEIIKLLDQQAVALKHGVESIILSKKLAASCALLRKLPAESMGKYFEIAIQAFIAAPLPSAAKSYGGASSRIQKLQKQKLEAELTKLVEASGGNSYP